MKCEAAGEARERESARAPRNAREREETAPRKETPLLGRRVVINGLVAKPELNGRAGTAVSFDDDKGRYLVELDDTSLMIKPCNLLPREQERERAREAGGGGGKSKEKGEGDGNLLDYILDRLKESKCQFLTASQLGQDINKKEKWSDMLDRAGGLKEFCKKHDDKIAWIADGGGGKLQIVKSRSIPGGSKVSGSIPVGSKVCIQAKKPSHRWGLAHPWSVGNVRSISGGEYIVDFPEVKRWCGQEKDLTIFTGPDRSTKDIGRRDPAFDKFGFVRNKDGGRFEFTGEMKGREEALWEVGFVHGKQKLTPTNPYFEVTIIVNRADGVGIGLSEDSFFAGSMVGWESESIGFHSNNGHMYYQSRSGLSFGPTSCAGDTIGCGIIFDASGKPQTIFFTRNRSTVGIFPLRSRDYDMVFPVVTSASPAVVTVNLSAMLPAISMACVLNTFLFEAKYNDSSNKFKPVSIKGPKNSKGETPVIFNGYKDTVWVPHYRLRRTETPKQIEFSDLEQAFSSVVDGDTIEVRDCGIHLLRDPINIRSTVSVVAVDAAKRPTISRGHGLVFEVFADTLLKNIYVKSFGGDKSKEWSSGGACGVVLRKGNLTIKKCVILSEQGTGVAVDNDCKTAPCRRLAIEKCQVGPCGRHGIFLERCAEIISIKGVKITSVEKVSIGSNGGHTNISQCVIQGSKDCKSSSAVQLAGAEDKVATMTMNDCIISNFNEGIQVSGDLKIKMERKLTLTGCTIENCKVAIKAKGPQAKIFFDETNAVKHCSKETTVENGGQIISGEVAAALVPTPAVEDPAVSPGPKKKSPTSSESVTSSVEVQKVSEETANFARYWRLLWDVGRDVLAAVFKGSFKKEKNKQWTESCGQFFLNEKFPDGASLRQLGKRFVDNIRAGKCEEWDITLLSSLLMYTPGYINDNPEARRATNALREERNSLAHSADLFARRSLNELEFNDKWGSIKGALDVLMKQLLPAEKELHCCKINEIDTENFGQSALEPLFERVQQDIKHIQDLAEDGTMPSEIAMALLSKMDTERGSRDVTLSNQKRYRLIKQVGKGAMGTVFEAKLLDSESGGGKLALKICHADRQSRAEREADIMRRLGMLKHENIVKFLDHAFLDGSHLVIIMELIEGTSLDEWLENRYCDGSSGVTLDETRHIVMQLAEGMAAVHAENIAHRDLKPGNLIFDEVTGKLVIVDFGLSKMHNSNSTMTSTNNQIGTLLYMSPEQIDGDIEGISFPSDIWSIGIIWHEMITNYTPFELSASRKEPGNSASRSQRRTFSKKEEHNMLTEVLKEGPRELPMLLSQPEKVPKAVSMTIAKCLNVNKVQRFQNAQDLLNHLTGLFEKCGKEREKKKEDGPQTPDKCKTKPFEQWSVDEVCRLVKSIGFEDSAEAIKVNRIDGRFLSEMLSENHPDYDDLITSIADGGLGFQKMQLKVVNRKIDSLLGAEDQAAGSSDNAAIKQFMETTGAEEYVAKFFINRWVQSSLIVSHLLQCPIISTQKSLSVWLCALPIQRTCI
jgi:serine/threonine protein kinase